MGKGMCDLRFSPSKIEYSNEDNVKIYFFRLFCVYIFFNFNFEYFNIFFHIFFNYYCT